MEPLAYSLRPSKFDDIYGQKHLIDNNGPIRRMVRNNKISSMILYGGPGIGKTTLAYTICNELQLQYGSFNASIDNKAKLKSCIDEANMFERYILIIDEIHRMKKDIQDYLLPFLESGKIYLIGITTVNPYNSVNPAIRSRCLIFKLNSLNDDDLSEVVDKTLKYLNNITIDDDAKQYLVNMANGDVRFIINNIEGISFIIDNHNITLEDAKTIVQRPSVNIDKNGDNYYDTLSGLQKSIRGSDINASMHYLAKLLSSEDLVPLIRRLSVIAYEDIGLANPGMALKVKAASEVALEVGMPEARIPFAAVVAEMALSPKSNSAYLALDAAISDIENGKSGNLPIHLKNTYSFDPNQKEYIYPHDYPGAWVDQQYLPDPIKDAEYYHPKNTSKYEKALSDRYEAIKKAKNKSK